jgi:hypothetical protein
MSLDGFMGVNNSWGFSTGRIGGIETTGLRVNSPFVPYTVVPADASDTATLRSVLINPRTLLVFAPATSKDACIYDCVVFFFSFVVATQRRSWPPHSRGFLHHAQRRTTVGRTPLDEWSARRKNLHLKTDKHPCPGRDSNQQSQQASGRRPTT